MEREKWKDKSGKIKVENKSGKIEIEIEIEIESAWSSKVEHENVIAGDRDREKYEQLCQLRMRATTAHKPLITCRN